ncbi:MAG: Pyridoxine 5'-phosphate synthase [Calditrichaeota bacterium]|nr:Pyridoxine 5'-phosphate synthase [Calditrichota bacterium]
MRLALRLDPILQLHGGPMDTGPVARAAAIASLAGADSLVVPIPATDSAPWKRPLRAVKEVFDGPVAVTCPLRDDPLRLALELRPDMVILTARQGGVRAVDGDDLTSQAMKEAASSLSGSHIRFGVYAHNQLAHVKTVRHHGADTVVLDGSRLAAGDDPGQALSALETLETLSLGAEKLELGVFIEGDFDRFTCEPLMELAGLEGVILGNRLVMRAVALGLAGALAEFREFGGSDGRVT